MYGEAVTLLRVCRHGTYDPKTGCLQCKREDNRRRNAKSKRHGLRSPWWPGLRAAVFFRAQYRCEWSDCTSPATTVDYERGGVHTRNPADYKAYCAHHHGVKDGARSHA
jgi:hypothetical protein